MKCNPLNEKRSMSPYINSRHFFGLVGGFFVTFSVTSHGKSEKDEKSWSRDYIFLQKVVIYK